MARKAETPARKAETPARKAAAPSRPAQLAEIAFDRKRHGDIEKELAELSPEEARLFLHLIEQALRKRKIMLFGYLLALVAILCGSMLSFWVYATREPGQFVGWVFVLPLGSVGLILWLFGRWANRQ